MRERTVQRACLILGLAAVPLFLAGVGTGQPVFGALGAVLVYLAGQLGFIWIGYICFKSAVTQSARTVVLVVLLPVVTILGLLQFDAIRDVSS